MDYNDNGILSKRELRGGMSQLGQRMSKTDINSFFSLFDKDGDGGLSKSEYIESVRASAADLEL